MKETKFTPGPWRAQERLSGSENHKGWIVMSPIGVVGEVYPLSEDPTPAARANVKLIAAAPALYSAVIRALALFNLGLQRASSGTDISPLVEAMNELYRELYDAASLAEVVEESKPSTKIANCQNELLHEVKEATDK